MLQKIGFQPGINKQITPTGAEGQWIDCDNVRTVITFVLGMA